MTVKKVPSKTSLGGWLAWNVHSRLNISIPKRDLDIFQSLGPWGLSDFYFSHRPSPLISSTLGSNTLHGVDFGSILGQCFLVRLGQKWPKTDRKIDPLQDPDRHPPLRRGRVCGWNKSVDLRVWVTLNFGALEVLGGQQIHTIFSEMVLTEQNLHAQDAFSQKKLFVENMWNRRDILDFGLRCPMEISGPETASFKKLEKAAQKTLPY